MSIGLLNEGPLHAALKATYAANGGAAEVDIEGFVADAVRNGIVYEIQTGSFSGLQRKLEQLVERQPVVLVHPIARSKLIVKQAADGQCSQRRSPKKGALVHIVNELVYLPALLNHPNFTVEVLLTDERELRCFDARKKRGRGGWRVLERQLLGVVEGMRLNAMEDVFEFLEDDLIEPFSARELAQAVCQPLDIGQKMAYCLRVAGVTEVSGKRGNALLYVTR
jgi:hypothetical protein